MEENDLLTTILSLLYIIRFCQSCLSFVRGLGKKLVHMSSNIDISFIINTT